MLRCNSSRPGPSASAVTDVRGQFLIQTTKVTNYAIHKCKLFLASSPLPGCDVPAGHDGGFPLKFVRNTVAGATKLALYTVGPFKLAPADPSLDKTRTAWYIPVRQLIGTRTGCYQAVPLRSAVDGRFSPSMVDFRRLRSI
ncbi:hypothetical protein BHM03_00002890 [Ensete ventricosum]|uniref:Uncharacterized protein n=1 Tax=Ensete ventricosum TaxID=4639 RepID=A0A445MA02_ENSVE|nr:hypothetical protein BHM03_00002890 [Ensete ventricosum]